MFTHHSNFEEQIPCISYGISYRLHELTSLFQPRRMTMLSYLSTLHPMKFSFTCIVHVVARTFRFKISHTNCNLSVLFLADFEDLSSETAIMFAHISFKMFWGWGHVQMVSFQDNLNTKMCEWKTKTWSLVLLKVDTEMKYTIEKKEFLKFFIQSEH